MIKSAQPDFLSDLVYQWRVIRACLVKDVRIALRTPAATVIVILLPLNFLILELLFAISGGQAPTAVVLQDTGPYAQQFLDTMRHAHSFNIIPPDGTTAEAAQQQIQSGNIVAVVTIPANFDDAIKAGQPIAIPVTLNNLNVDFSNDIRRALPLTITQFYAKAFPQQVVVQANEVDTYPYDTDYIPYLAVSIFVIGLLLGGLLQSGGNMVNEYEQSTIKEMLLSPASRWAIQVGKIGGALVINILSALVILIVVVIILGVHPQNALEVGGFILIVTPIFGSIGALLGTLLRKRAAIIPLSLGLALPLFFLSGPFGPATFGGAINALIARISPAYYAISTFQYAFHGFVTTPTGVVIDTLALIGFAVAAVVISAVALRRTSLSH